MMLFELSLLFCILFMATKSDAVDDYVFKMEDTIKKLAEQTLKQFKDFEKTQCYIKSYEQCKGTSELKCYKDYPTPLSCVGPGASLSTKSAIRLEPGTDRQNLSPEDKHVICSTARMEIFFQEIDNRRNQSHMSAYIGSNTGMLRTHPAIKQEGQENIFNCQNYDPRYRPWYRTAILGQKNLVFMIDNSHSLKQQLNAVKLAAQKFISNFGRKDSVIVLTLGNGVQYQSPPKIFQMNEQNINETLENVKNIVTREPPNYRQVLQKVYKMLTEAKQSDMLCCVKQSQPIQVVFVLFSDSLDKASYSQITQAINSHKNEFKIQFFTFTFAVQLSNQNQLQNLACDFYGQHFLILPNSSQSSIKNTIQKMYSFMARNQNFLHTWADFYDDAFGFGSVTTIMSPIYFKNETINYLVGVAGIDSPLSFWQSMGYNQSQAQQRISSTHKHKIQNISCSKKSKENNYLIFPDLKGQIFNSPQSTQTSRCCTITMDAFKGIIGGSVGLVAIITGVSIFICCRKHRKKVKQAQKNEQQNEPQQPETSQRLNTFYPHYSFGMPYIQKKQVLFPPPPPELFEDQHIQSKSFVD